MFWISVESTHSAGLCEYVHSFRPFPHSSRDYAAYTTTITADAPYATPFVYGTVSNNPMQSTATNQWNMWQQFQLPAVGGAAPPPPEQNRWSKSVDDVFVVE